MKQLKDYSDIRLKGWCIHCSRNLSQLKTSRDHVPSKCLLEAPLPQNLPVVEICEKCNGSYALDEEYLMVFLEVVLSGTTDPTAVRNSKIADLLKNNMSLRVMIEKSKKVNETSSGEKQILWQPDEDRI